MQFGHGRFTHKVPEFVLHKAAGSQNRMRLFPFPKKQMPKKKHMMGTIQGAKSDQEVSSENQRLAQPEVIEQWDVKGRS